MSQGSDSYASGRYLVQKKLGAGSFGAAYLVEDREAGSLLYVLYNQGCTEMMLFQHLLLRFCLATLSWPASRKVLKKVFVGTLEPGETVDALREAKILAKVTLSSGYVLVSLTSTLNR